VPVDVAVASSVIAALRTIASQQRGLTLVVLFGSRARGDAWAHADWDFGYLGDASVEPLTIMAALAEATGSEHLDLVDLARASGLLRYRAARDGVLVYEATPGLFDRFRFEAARFWYDAEPVLRPAYDAILDRLD
jgi:predicted nucleotidyltransferase